MARQQKPDISKNLLTRLVRVTRRSVVIAFIPVFLWMGLIFWCSSIPALQSGKIPDYVCHAGVYAILGWLVFRLVFFLRPGWSRNQRDAVCTIVCLYYALSDEFHQSFVAGRHASFRDIVADLVGVLLALLVLEVIVWKLRIEKENSDYD